jgi:peptide/nickel transport system permease protein
MAERHVLLNSLVIAVLVAGAVLARTLRRDRYWREALAEVYRRRRVAVIFLLLFFGVALADTVSWVGNGPPPESGFLQPRSLIDRLFPEDFRERSYSAPLASVEFYGGQPLRYPAGHLLGTDILGRDVFHMTLKGAKVALLIGGLTSAIAIPLALLFGVPAGYFGRRVDDVVVFIINTLASMPGILLLIALVLALGRGPVQVCVALAITGWTGLCRLVRGETLKLRELDYVQAARALGVSEFRIIVRHIIPNLMHLVVISFVLMFSGLVLSEAVLSWLGIGIDGSWGQMIDQARDELSRDPIIWWNLAAASTALFTLVLCINVVGDAVRDVLDPRTVRETS